MIGDRLFPVGTLDFEVRPEKQLSAFRYSDEWLELDDAFALSPTLPLSRQPVYASGSAADPRPALPGVFSDCAPDGWGRRLILRDSTRRPSELDYLLAVNDSTRHGALRFLDQEGVPLSYALPPVPRMTRLNEMRRLAYAFETNRGDVRAVAHALRGAGSSLGGARPKSDFMDPEDVLYIAKYTSDQDDLPVERMEVVALRLATEVGLRTAQATLTLAETRTPVALIKRFDRSGADRLHYISARTFLGNTGAEDAYYTDLADSMRAYCGSAEGVREELRELYRRIMFTILVSNEDDHLKNHGFLYDGNGSWRLSPAFDINPTPDRRAYLKTGISELSGYNASIEAAIEAAPLFELREDDVLAEAQHMAAIIAQRWRPLCQEMGMNRDECARYVPAFQNPELLSMLALKQADDSGLGTV